MSVIVTTLIQVVAFTVSWYSIFAGCAGMIMCVGYKLFSSEMLIYVASYLILGLSLRQLAGITLQVNDYDTLIKRYRVSGVLTDNTVRTLTVALCALFSLNLLLSYIPSYTDSEKEYISTATDGAIAGYVIRSKPERIKRLNDYELVKNIDLTTVDYNENSETLTLPSDSDVSLDSYREMDNALARQQVLVYMFIFAIGVCDRLIVRNRKFKIYKELLKEYKYGNIGSSE